LSDAYPVKESTNRAILKNESKKGKPLYVQFTFNTSGTLN